MVTNLEGSYRTLTLMISHINIVTGFNSSYDVRVVNCEEKLDQQDVGTRGTSIILC